MNLCARTELVVSRVPVQLCTNTQLSASPGYEGEAVIQLCQNAQSAGRSLDGWVAAFGLPYNCSRWAFGAL
jgi:hypothetical protein